MKKNNRDSEVMKLKCWISYFPKPFSFDVDKKPSWLLTEFDITKKDREAGMALIGRQDEFKKTKNPVHAIEVLLLAHELKVYPPRCVLDFLADGFKRYHDKLGLVDLDSILGLKGVGKRGGAFGPLLNEQRDDILMRDVYWLTRLGYSVSQAASIVARYLENIPDSEFNKTWVKIKKISASRIEDLWNKKHGKTYREMDKNEPVKKIRNQWLEKNGKKFIQKFKVVLSEEELKILPRRKR